MYKVIFTIIIILVLAWVNPVDAVFSTDFINNEAPSAYFYPGEFDKLVLDLTIPSGVNGGEDKLLTITIKNNGSAVNLYDIEKFKLWKDADEPGFQGMGKDEELGIFIYYASNISWYLSDLNAAVPADGLRIFISAEISKNATTNRSVQIKIPQLDDINSNGSFDLADSGIFMESKNNGPSDSAIANSYFQTLKTFSNKDNLNPKTVITDPEDNSTITVDNYTIKGMTRDQGTSNPAWVKIGINPLASSEQVIWHEVNLTSSNYLTWEYQWQNITEGNYTIKTQSTDWIENTETEGDSVNVVVKFPGEPASAPNGGATAGEEDKEESAFAPDGATADTVEQLQEKIKQVQQQIIELLNQLIQIYLQKLG